MASGKTFFTIVLDILFKVRDGTSAELYEGWKKNASNGFNDISMSRFICILLDEILFRCI